MMRTWVVCFAVLLALRRLTYSEASEAVHSRQKRVLWLTNDGRIALPPGTVMTITPTLALPFVRHPPYGFLSNMTISLPFTSKSIVQYYAIFYSTFHYFMIDNLKSFEV